MNSLESIRELLTKHLQDASRYTEELQKLLLILGTKDFHCRVYDVFFNLVADTTLSPESIVHLLDTYTSGLEGFSTNKSIQAVVAFACFEGLAKRRPKLLIGPWETLVWIIVKYSSLTNTPLGNALMAFRETNKTTPNWITKFASQELCPNPCLRLELFGFIRAFQCNSFIEDRKSFRDNVINTIIELYDNNTTLTVDQVPNFSPMDLQAVMKDNGISMRFIMNDYDLDLKKTKIIAGMFKLTKKFALLMKEKYQRLNNDATAYELRDHVSLEVQLSACLLFCGLIPEISDIYLEHDECLLYLVHAVGKDSFLLNDVIDTLDTITQVSISFPEEDDLNYLVPLKKNKLLHRFFKGHVNRLHKYQYLQEIHGGISPAAEYRLRYFQNISIDQYNDSEYDSECYASDENDNILIDSQENDSAMDIPDEDTSYRDDMFYEEDFL